MLFHAIVAAGGVFSSASTAFTTRELVRTARTGNVKMLACTADYLDKTVATAKECGIPLSKVFVLDYSTPKQWRLNAVEGGRSFPDDADPMLGWARLKGTTSLQDTTICLLYSAGTNGILKGVLLSH